MDRNLWTSDRRLYLNAEGAVVEEGDSSKRTLLVAAGGTIPYAKAEALGLTQPARPAKAPAPAETEPGPTEPDVQAKALRQPPANKALSPAKDK